MLLQQEREKPGRDGGRGEDGGLPLSRGAKANPLTRFHRREEEWEGLF